jgi:F5/8 type C domain
MRQPNLQSRLAALVVAMGCCAVAQAASSPGDVVGKVTVGYQGWFACVGDGAPINQWWHYSGTTAPPTPVTLTNNLHAWPDMRQYANGYATAFTNFGNGQAATLFSSYDDQVVQTHFRWMAENNLDTAALQRFNPYSGEGPTRNDMAVKVKRAAELYNRKFYIMYDLSGWTTMQQEIKTDWTNVMLAQFQITNSPAYAIQSGKPVVGIWGMGFNDANHPWDTNTCVEVITWFKNQGCYVMGGVLTWWRTGASDSRSNFLSAYSAFDMISPWMVGRIGNISGADSFYSNPELGDQSYCNSHGIDYQPCVLPGDTGQRAHGDFMWRQFYNMKRLGCQGLYISMFDEYNEGNQIACTAENASMIPVGSGALYFTLDQDGTSCSSDYYLRLSGDGGKMLKGQIALTSVRPTLPRLPATLPLQPTNLVAQAGNTQVRLSWAAAAGAERYAVKRSSASTGPFTALSTNVGLLSFTDSGLVNGTVYFYAVSAANALGESTNSPFVGAIPHLAVASASSDNPLNETAAKAFDGLTSTKWYNAGAGTIGWLRYYFGGPQWTVVRYDLTSANDVPGRDPKNWQFQGSQDGNVWATLDTRTGETFPSRYQTKQYPISNNTAYAYYRLNITGNNGDASGLQLAEMAFTFGPATPASLIPIQLGASEANGQVRLTWPADHLGWRLQTQTNSLNNGLGANWTTVAGSTATNQFFWPNSMTGNAFFRLTYP